MTTPRRLPELDYTDPALRRFLAAPNLVARLNDAVRAATIDPDIASAIARDLNLHIRAEKGERWRTRLYDLDPAEPDPGFAFPFTQAQEHRPDRTPGTPAHSALDAGKTSLETEEIQRGLAARMGNDTTPPPETSWDRTAETPSERAEVAERRAAPAYRDAAAEPSLHETIRSSVNALGG